MLSLVDPSSVRDDLTTDNLVIDCVSLEGRSTTGVLLEVAANDNSVTKYITLCQYVYNVNGSLWVYS